MRKTIFLSLAIFFSIIIIVFFNSLKTNKIYNTEDLIGKKIPILELELLNKSEKIYIGDFQKNRFTLINFFASWCGPCRKEHKFLIDPSKNTNMPIIGINFKDKKNNANNFLKKLGNPYDFVAKDDEGKKSVNFGVYGIPETILINSDLIILKKYIGPINAIDVKEIKKIIKTK